MGGSVESERKLNCSRKFLYYKAFSSQVTSQVSVIALLHQTDLGLRFFAFVQV
eukprot:COSAG02_NODE_5286_length_4470_cov_2.533745_4_plen_53_part_00